MLGCWLCLLVFSTAACTSMVPGHEWSSEGSNTSGPAKPTDQPAQPIDLPSGPPPAAVKKLLKQKVRAMRERPVLGFSFKLSDHDTLVQRVSGFHDGPNRRWQAKGRTIEPGEPVHHMLEARSIADRLWMQMDEWSDGAKGCWMVFPEGTVPSIHPGMSHGEPQYISILFALSPAGRGEQPNSLLGTLPLEYLRFMVAGEQATAPFDVMVERGLSTSVPVTIGYDGHGITSITLQGVDMVKAFETAEVELEFTARQIFRAMRFEFAYTDWAGSTRVEAPAEELEFTAGSGGCHGIEHADVV